ncbi:MAG: C1 family peptidase [Acidobacteriota bacterium]
MRFPLKIMFLLAALAAVPAAAQYKPVSGEAPAPQKALTPYMLNQLENSVKMTPQLRADRNALAAHSIRSLTVNQALENRTDDLFTHVIKHPGSITNQKDSGRCWLFAGLHLLRPVVMNKYTMKDFTLSLSYEQFYPKLEEAKRSLELAIALRNEPLHSRRMDTFLKYLISDGGDWNYVQALIQKYGAVPRSIMPNDLAASHTGEMNELLSARLRKAVLQIRSEARKGASVKRLRAMKMGTLKDVYKILVLCLGQPPETFQWRYETRDGKVSALKTYTPKSFYTTFIGGDLNDFVFLQRMYDAGAGDYFDVLAMQGYGLWSGPTDRRMRARVLNFSRPLYLREIMVENGDAHKPIWITEMNWNAPPADLPDKAYGYVTPEQQAQYAVLAYQRAQQEWPWVGVVNTWFFKRATDAERDQAMYYFRLVEPDFTPTPVYEALKRFMHSAEAQVLYPGVYQEDHWALIYDGSWAARSDPSAELGSYRYAEAPESGVTFSFSGTDLWIKMGPGPGGTFSYLLDGETEGSATFVAGEQIHLAGDLRHLRALHERVHRRGAQKEDG